MDNTYRLCMLFVVFHLIAVPSLVWAVRHRQLRGSDQETFALVDGDDEPDFSGGASTIKSPRRAGWFTATLASLFLLIGSSVILTLVIATHPAPSATKNATAAKCPF